nr:MAG TPA: hypothetical protein [Bacteriophage sp.]DAX13763.1 MAG TPA: hypothetical protein [Bacteriophage sp.]
MHEDVRRLLGVVHHDVLVEKHSRYGMFFRFLSKIFHIKMGQVVYNICLILFINIKEQD